MAKLEEDKIVENKLEKDNKDIEKIKDDVEAQEDNIKEEKKNSSKVNDDIGFSKYTNKKLSNKIEKDDEGEEDLEDDVDADKDYWKEKANSLEKKCTEMEKELCAFKRADEEKKMAEEIDKFAHCMSEDEATELKNSIKNMSIEEMKEKINSKVADFALKLKNEQNQVMKYSVNPLFSSMDVVKFSDKETKNLADIIKNSHVQINGK